MILQEKGRMVLPPSEPLGQSLDPKRVVLKCFRPVEFALLGFGPALEPSPFSFPISPF